MRRRDRPAGVPRQAHDLIGRQRELDALARLAQHPLVTLVGPPGVGKTRLALAWTEREGGTTVFVDLADARDASDVVAHVLAAHGLANPEGAEGEAQLRQLAYALGRAPRRTLLDNAEHVVAAVADLVVACRSETARFVVTSRQPLGIAGEQRFELTALAPADAIALFEARAHPADSLRRTPSEQAAVADIVARLELLPLAIELAAARTSLLLPSEIARLLATSSGLLRDGGRDAHPRQSSLHAAIAWSYRLLEPDAQAALICCAVFHDGFTAEAAAAVIGVADRTEAIERLQALRDRSLLRTVATHATRFHLYASVRAFALDELARAPHAAGVRARHVAYYAQHAGDPDELGNVLAAQRAALVDAPEVAAQLALAVVPVLATRYPMAHRLALLDGAVAAAERAGRPDLLARVLVARGHLRRLAARLDDADADLARAISVDPAHASVAELVCARVAIDRGALQRAHDHATRAATGEARAAALHVLGWTQTQLGRLAQAERTLAQALDLCLDRGDRATEGAVIGAMGELAHVAGQVAEAITLRRHAIAIAGEVGDRALEVLERLNLGYTLCEVPDFAAAAACCADALEGACALGDQRLEILALAALGFAEQGRGRLVEAATHTTAALRVPAGGHGAFIARLCHAAVRAEAGHVTEARALFAALGDAASAMPDHHFGRVLAHARAFVAIGLALARDAAGDREAARVAVEPVRAQLAGPPPDDARRETPPDNARRETPPDDARRETQPDDARRHPEHPDVRLWRIALGCALARVDARVGRAGQRVEIERGGRWFRRDPDPRVACGQRPVLRKLLVVLARARLEAPGRPVAIEDLLDAAWAGQKMRSASGRRRLQVAISRLRELGLEGVVVNDPDGYFLDPGIDVVLVADAAA